MTGLLTLSLKYEQDVVTVRQRARQIAAGLGFDSQDQVRIATAVSEIARNAFSYAGGGKVEFHVQMHPTPQAMIIRIVDEGPGIANLEAVLAGSYRSRTGMGLGIVGARRLMDECDIRSHPGKGTEIHLTKSLPKTAPAVTAASLARIVDELIAKPPQTPYDEVQQQNQELLRTVEEVRQRQDELGRLNRELEDTNRGVVALYAELDEKADSLRRADESKTRFLSNMGHEFRTPLNSIRGITRLLLDHLDGPLTEEQDKQVRFIRKAAEDLSTMVDDLLDLAKIEAGRVEVRPVQFTVNELFSALRGMLRPLLVGESVHLVFEDCDHRAPLFTDEGKLSQILRNFISNALKFTELGEVRLRTELLEDEQAMRFAVADTGIGIAPEDQERIFEEFTQIENPLQKRIKGTGLGLPLCRRLATLLGGRVELESTVGLGSTFSVIIPLDYRAAASTSAAVSGGNFSPAAAGHSDNPLVLIIDDEEAARYFLAKLLAGYPLQVEQASDGTTGLNSARERAPELIFLDIRMPDKNGAEVLAALKADPATAAIPVVMVSSLTLDENEKRQFAGAAAILRKDEVSPDVVRGILARASLL
jgi:signal transduction histidine kinase